MVMANIIGIAGRIRAISVSIAAAERLEIKN